MPRRAKGVTTALVQRGTKPGRVGDGGGLYLLTRSRHAKFWLFRFKRGGRLRELGLGPAVGRAAVTLAQARTKARELHTAVREGHDPLAERKSQKAQADADALKVKSAGMTFSDVADMYLAAHEASWRNAKHRLQWRNTLDQYVMPVLGKLPVAQVTTAEVMRILESLWRTKTETASRVRGRIEAVLDYAKARNWREGENPARWRGHLDQLLPKRSKVQRIEHFPALPWREIGQFMERLRFTFSVSARCLEFLILTAVRSGEARGARWDEIDLDREIWTIPAKRMKGGREHRVPLSKPAIAILRQMAQFSSQGLVFPGLRSASALSDVSLTAALHAAGGSGSTVHGLRSTFRDWADECTIFPRELCELALAHRTFQGDDGREVGGRTEEAYRRGDMLERRRKLMADWAAFCARPMVAGEVIPLRAAASE
jgi:integrase